MTRFMCNGCGGVYSDQSPAGVAYYHVCPPVPVLEDREVAGELVAVVVGEKRRDGHRNENTVPVYAEAPDGGRFLKETKIVSEGAGRTELPPEPE